MSILEALGVAEFPAPDSLKKILNDHLVCQRAQELMVEHFAAEAIAKMHPVEKAALLKKISPTPKPLHKVSWSISGGTNTGRPYIMGSCGQCGQTCHWDGKPEGAKYILWAHCQLGPSKIPESVIEQYATSYGYQI